MGRIKTLMVRKAADELFEKGQGFNENFDNNKKILNNTMPSKSLRNKIAGQIARLAKQKRLKDERSHRHKQRTEEEQ